MRAPGEQRRATWWHAVIAHGVPLRRLPCCLPRRLPHPVDGAAPPAVLPRLQALHFSSQYAAWLLASLAGGLPAPTRGGSAEPTTAAGGPVAQQAAPELLAGLSHTQLTAAALVHERQQVGSGWCWHALAGTHCSKVQRMLTQAQQARAAAR